MLFTPVILPVRNRSFSVTATDSYNDSASRTTFTLTGKAFGAAHSTREIFFFGRLSAGSGISWTSFNCTIAGVTAQVALLETPLSNTTGAREFIAWAPVPTGTTGNIVLTISPTMQDLHSTIIRVVDRAHFNSPPISIDRTEVTAATSTSIIANDVPSDAFCLGHIGKGGTNGFTTAAPFTEFYDNNGSTTRFLFAYAPPAATGSRTFSTTWSGSGDGGGSLSVWR